MRFMPIVPVHHIELLDNWDSVLVLPQYLVYPKYRDYLFTRRWHTVIVDNGYWEYKACFPVQYLEDIADRIQAEQKFVVLPETEDSLETIVLSLKIQCKYQGMVVLRSDNVLWYKLDLPAIAIALHKQDMYQRLKLVSRLKGLRPDTYVHVLGCDTLDELLALKKAGADSCDSSFPCSRAVAHVDLDHLSPRLDLSGVYPDDVRAMQQNLERVKQALGDGNGLE